MGGLSHWWCGLLGDIGPLALLLPLALHPKCHAVSSFLCLMLLLWCTASLEDPKQWANQSWAEASKNVIQNKPFLFWNWLFQEFVIVTGSWLTQSPKTCSERKELSLTAAGTGDDRTIWWQWGKAISPNNAWESVGGVLTLAVGEGQRCSCLTYCIHHRTPLSTPLTPWDAQMQQKVTSDKTVSLI